MSKMTLFIFDKVTFFKSQVSTFKRSNSHVSKMQLTIYSLFQMFRGLMFYEHISFHFISLYFIHFTNERM